MGGLEKILDYIFPKKCVNCTRKGSYLCLDCRKGLRIKGCEARPPKGIEKLVFALEYNNLTSKLIKQFKYRYCKNLGESLGAILSKVAKRHFDLNDFAVTPVPLDKWKMKMRGFNQAESLARGVKTVEVMLGRSVNKMPQAGLSRRMRLKNLQGVFYVMKPSNVSGKKVLLIDDVVTTGSTLSCCAQVLLEAGASSVSALVLAKRS